MLYHLLFPLAPQFGVLNVTRYITFRTAVASISALVISLVLGPWLIRRLRDFQIGQVIRQEGPQSHRAKAGTRAAPAVMHESCAASCIVNPKASLIDVPTKGRRSNTPDMGTMPSKPSDASAAQAAVKYPPAELPATTIREASCPSSCA